MINLLPPREKRQILAGQTNVILWRYCIVSLLLAGLLFIITGGVYYVMASAKADAESTIETSNRKTAKYQKVQQQVTEFTNNLTTAKTILDKEVQYSKIAVKIAQVLPSNVILESLTLDAKTFGTPTTLNALGKSYDDALRLKTNLEQSDAFQDVHLLSVSQSVGDTNTGYPISIAINVTINSEVIEK